MLMAPLKAGELACSDINQMLVIRTSWVHCRFGNNFVKNYATFVAGTRYYQSAVMTNWITYLCSWI
jgi:dTDP-4-dehydrorhamnose reductase